MAHPLPALPIPNSPFCRKLSNDRDDDDDDLGLANSVPVVQSVPSLWGIPLKYISCVTIRPGSENIPHTHLQTGDAGRPELSIDAYYALLPCFNPSVADVLCSNSGPHERNPKGNHLSCYCIHPDGSWTCFRIRHGAGAVSSWKQRFSGATTEIMERSVQSGLLETLDTSDTLWCVSSLLDQQEAC